jgi:hypothetical protein
MAFTDEDKARILHYLGYPHFSNIGLARGFGHPSAGPASDLVYDAFSRLSDQGEQRVRKDLNEIDCLEIEIAKLRGKAAITRTSDISFDMPGARRMLMAELGRLIKQLSLDLGAPPNPYSRYGAGPRVTG